MKVSPWNAVSMNGRGWPNRILHTHPIALGDLDEQKSERLFCMASAMISVPVGGFTPGSRSRLTCTAISKSESGSFLSRQ